MTRWSRLIQWQLPYAAYACAYLPGTYVKRSLRGDKYRGFDPLGRRGADMWGVLEDRLTHRSGPRPVWIHMHSGGEVVNARGFLDALDVTHGPYVLSTEGYDSHALLSRYYGGDKVFFSPWDLGLSARRVLNVVRPRAIVCMQNAYYPTLLRLARRAGIRTLLLNALLSRNVEIGNQPLQRSIALGFQHELDAISVQSEEDRKSFLALGVSPDRITVTGNLASDLSHLQLGPSEREQLRRDLGLAPTDPVIVVGSAPAGELSLLADAFLSVRRQVPDARCIFAPRFSHEATLVEDAFRGRGLRTRRRTQLGERPGCVDFDVLVLDTFGELALLYGIADVAYIGATLVPINARRGGHNPMEPLAHGVVPLFGPNLNLWSWVADALCEAWPAIQVASGEQLADRVVDVLKGRAPTDRVRAAGTRLVAASSGAIIQTVEFLHMQLGTAVAAR